MTRSKMPPFSNAGPTTETAPDSRRTKPRASNPNRGAKPGERRGGRQKGTVNKVTKDIREAIRELLETCAPKMGEWLEQVATNDPAKAIDLALKAAEFAIPKLSRAQVDVQADGNLAERLEAARKRRAQMLDGETDPEFREYLREMCPPMFIVSGVPDASPSAPEEVLTRPMSVPAFDTPVPPPLRLPGQAPSAASAEPPRLHTPHVTNADFDPYPN